MYSEPAMQDEPSRKLPILLLVLGVLAVLAAWAYSYWMLTRHAAPAQVPGTFGAIATSSTSLDFGSAWGYGDAASAEHRALAECNARIAHADCEIRLSMSNGCGALAVSAARGESVVAPESDKTLAGALALAQCQATGAEDCAVRQEFCGDGS